MRSAIAGFVVPDEEWTTEHSMDDGEEETTDYLEKLDRFLSGKEQTTLYFELEKVGEAPKLSEQVSDVELHRNLTELVWGLWDFGVIIDDADHLSDRELYEALLDLCDELTVVFPDNPNAWFHWSPIGGCSEEDIQISLKYYSDDVRRAWWLEQFPEDALPEEALPPYFRSWLPQRSNLTH